MPLDPVARSIKSRLALYTGIITVWSLVWLSVDLSSFTTPFSIRCAIRTTSPALQPRVFLVSGTPTHFEPSPHGLRGASKLESTTRTRTLGVREATSKTDVYLFLNGVIHCAYTATPTRLDPATFGCDWSFGWLSAPSDCLSKAPKFLFLVFRWIAGKRASWQKTTGRPRTYS